MLGAIRGKSLSGRTHRPRWGSTERRLPQRSGADQAVVGYTSQTISDLPTQTEAQAINDGIVDAVALLIEFRVAPVGRGLVKGSV